MGMKPDRAIQLDNIFPHPGYVEPRKGRVVQCDTGSADPVESLMAYHGLATAQMKAAAGAIVYDVTSDVQETELTGQSNARWQHVNFTTLEGLNVLWICNGADDSQRWDGSAWTVNTITGDATGDQIIQVTVFKKRIWGALVGELNPVYLDVGAVQGAATLFPLDGVFQKGGFLMAIGTWSIDGGEGSDDHIAFVSSRGEVAVYSGLDPESDFALVGVYTMGPPIGRRCLLKVGADLAVLCIDGVVPLSKALITERGAAVTIALTANIQPVVNSSAQSYKDLFGWQLASYPRGTMAILNVPFRENLEQRQYVMNTITGAWCRFLGQHANCWEVLNDRLYFGGNDGVVYEADRGGSDNGEPIECELRTAFNYFGNSGSWKSFPLAQTIIATDRRVDPALDLDCDFAQGMLDSGSPVASPLDVATWDVATWDVDEWPAENVTLTEWRVTNGEGYCASVHMKFALGVAA